MIAHPNLVLLHGRRKVVVQTVWLILTVLVVGTFAMGVPVRWDYLRGQTESLPVFGMPAAQEAASTSRLGPQELPALQTLGISPEFYAGYILFFEVGLALVCTLIGLLIFLRRSDDRMALLYSFSLILLGTNSTSFVVPSLALIAPRWIMWSSILQLLGMTSNLYLLFLSPDGRFVPRWTQKFAAGFTGLAAALVLYWLVVFELWVAYPVLLLALLPWVLLIGLGIWSQIHRYRHVSDAIQRQQSKWLVVGLAVVAIGFLMNGAFVYAAFQSSGVARLLYQMVRASLVHLCMMVLPVCIAFSILRYRLWDIDILIRRTLTYGLVTALLLVVFFGSVILLQQIFAGVTGSGQNELVTVLSTLAIAALFVPLRNRVQATIDRRFNRKKYDAQQVLTEFAKTVRDETDLEKLGTRLMQVVDETMQPKSVSVWLRNEADRQTGK